MKVIKKKTFEVSYVVPETADENEEIQRIIREVNSEKIDPKKTEWRIVDNRSKSES